ncbi:MAG TPA: rod shape-determining protein MreC [Deltaproteobacteria bacterium]|nr:rod shape-determining protein MreC [Deltaproteobacteria bacterium]
MLLLKRIKPIIFFVFVTYVLLYVFSLNYKKGQMSLLEKAVVETIGPIQKGVHHIFSYAGSFFDEYINLVGVKQENEELKAKLSSLESELNNYREAYLANQRLRELLGLKKSLSQWPTLAAEVITWDPSGWFQTITIDKGFLDGIQIGMPVVNAKGVVGKITALSRHYARALLLIDPNFAIDSYIQRNRVYGIVSGYKNGMCRMQYVQQNQDVKEGDVVVTSGMAGYFPKGLPIGTITKIKINKAQLFQEIYVKPYVDFSKLEEVLVILKERPVVNYGKPYKNH